MNNLNSVIIEGNVCKEPTYREPAEDFKVCTFPVAVNRWYKSKNGTGEEEVSYFDVDIFGKMAEICKNKLKTGTGVRVVGRLKQNRWEDSTTGKMKSVVHVIAEHIEFKPIFTQKDEKATSETTEKNETPKTTATEVSEPKETQTPVEENVTETNVEITAEPVTISQTEAVVF